MAPRCAKKSSPPQPESLAKRTLSAAHGSPRMATNNLIFQYLARCAKDSDCDRIVTQGQGLIPSLHGGMYGKKTQVHNSRRTTR